MKGEVTQTQEHKLTSNSILKFPISRMCFTRVNVHLRNQSVIKNNTFAVVESIHVCLHHITIQVSTHLSTNPKTDCCRQESRKDIWEIAICREKEQTTKKQQATIYNTCLDQPSCEWSHRVNLQGSNPPPWKANFTIVQSKDRISVKEEGLHYCDWSAWNHQSQTTSLVET